MPKILSTFLTRRGVTAATALAAGCLLAAGCGSSSHGPASHQAGGPATTTATSSSSTSSAASAPPPSGSALSAGLTKNMAAQQRQLKEVKTSCPAKISRYPVKCHFTATEDLPHSKKTLRMAGTITVTGGSSNGSYEYGLNYAPVH